ncbi:MAG TPA: LacI family DNA-binding transcriptional regulator, partial [Novosphingobium sp.]|nr:LacI family DNA-binding transcriptional regulator [Novosphingobium sp.]
MKQSRKDKSRVTIQAVAAKAGVSPMTVSNVFNRKGKVGEDTRRRVLAVIDEMGYVPSQAARHLVGAAPARIGILYHDTSSMFINAALAAVTIAASQRGLQLLMREAGSFEPERIFESAAALVRSGADGLLLLPPFAEVLAHCAQFAALGVPAAAIATARALPGMSTVRIDNQAAAQAVTSLLIANGRR